jgi:hypothetical protein
METMKSPRAVMKASPAPAASAGRSSGRVTRARRRQRLAPSEAAGIELAQAGERRPAGQRQVAHEIGERQQPGGADQHEAAEPGLVDAEGGGEGDREDGAGHRPGDRDHGLEQPPDAVAADRRQPRRGEAERQREEGGRGRHPERVDDRPQVLGRREQPLPVVEVEHRREGLGGPGEGGHQRDQQQHGVRQQQQDGEQPAEQAGGGAGERALQAPAGRRDPAHPGPHRHRAVGPAHGAQGQQGEGGEHHRLHLRQGELAVELGGDDLGGHHPEAAAEHVGGGE